MPIHNAQPEVAANAKPARRMAHAPECPPLTRSNSHDPAVSETDVPAEKAAITTAPSTALADNEATNRAEYSRPQGINAHPTPNTTGALPPMAVMAGFALRQTR